MARTRLIAVAVVGASTMAVGASIASNFAGVPTPGQLTFALVAVLATLGVALHEQLTGEAASQKTR